MNRDFVEMLSALSAAGAEYLVVSPGAEPVTHEKTSLSRWASRKPTVRFPVADLTFGAPVGYFLA